MAAAPRTLARCRPAVVVPGSTVARTRERLVREAERSRSALGCGARRLQRPRRGGAHARPLARAPRSSCSSRRPRRRRPRTRRSTLPLLARARCARGDRRLRARAPRCAPGWIFRRIYGAHGIRVRMRAARVCRPRLRSSTSSWRRRSRDGRSESHTMSDTLVFIPAWNEEDNLPAVLDALHAELPDADVLVVDDGSTDRTADVAREHGAEVHSLGIEPRPPLRHRRRVPLRTRARLRVLRPRRRRRPAPAGRARAPARAGARRRVRRRRRLAVRLRRRLSRVPLPPEPGASLRHRCPSARDGLALGRTFGDATSGLYAVNAMALPLLARDLHEPRAGGRGARPDRERRPTPRGSARHDGSARERRVEASRLEGGQARPDGRRHPASPRSSSDRAALSRSLRAGRTARRGRARTPRRRAPGPRPPRGSRRSSAAPSGRRACPGSRDRSGRAPSSTA